MAAAWAKYSRGGHWLDADMLPVGYLGPRPGEGTARESNLTHDEQQSFDDGLGDLSFASVYRRQFDEDSMLRRFRFLPTAKC